MYHLRTYYSVMLDMLINGAFALSVCYINVGSDMGEYLRMNLLVFAVLVGPYSPC